MIVYILSLNTNKDKHFNFHSYREKQIILVKGCYICMLKTQLADCQHQNPCLKAFLWRKMLIDCIYA